MEVRVAQAPAVIVQHVPPAAKDQFLVWQRSIAHIAEGFAGYSGTDIFPPCDSNHDDWVVIQYFDDNESLKRWLAAPVRKQWIERIQKEMGQAQLTKLNGGFADWFTERVQQDAAVPAGWKMAMAVLLGLYPIVMLLTLCFPGPYTQNWGMALSMLVSNALSVSILQWAVMPVLNKVLGPWLQADRRRNARLFYGGIVLIFAALLAICAAFRELSG